MSGGIPLSTVQFQTYDSTESLSGCHKGAQQILSESLWRNILHTKCLPHCVNLVIEHASDASPSISKVFDSVEYLCLFSQKVQKDMQS